MKRLLKYLLMIFIVLVVLYGFWLWLQYKWSTVIKKTTVAVLNQLSGTDKLETISKTYTKIIEGEQELTTLTPNIGVDDIIDSALFKDIMKLEVEGIVSAGYILGNLTENDIIGDKEWNITIILSDPEVFWVTLTGELQTNKLGIITQKEITMEHQLREKASELIIQDALEWWILEEAKNNAQTVLQDILLKAGIQIKEVFIQSPWLPE